MGPSGARLVRQDEAAWTAGRGKWRRISDAPHRPPLPTPHLETLDQAPLGMEWDIVYIILVWIRVKCSKKIIRRAAADRGKVRMATVDLSGSM